MDMMALASRHVFVPLFERSRGFNVGRLRRHLLQSQYFSEEQIRGNQWRDLQRLLRYVYSHNHFYRKRFDQLGATPGDIKSFSDFASLPLLSKDDVRSNLESLVSDEFSTSDLLWRRTGGSTGVPLQAYWDKKGWIFKGALARRHDAWAHFLPGEKQAALWGNINLTSFRKRLANVVLWRTIFLDTLRMDDQNMLEFAERIKQTGTRLLFGHGHSIYFFARFLKDRSITDLRFDGIISSAEALPPEERRVVEEMFGNVVFDRYGSEEVAHIAAECEEHEGMHVAAEGVYVEILEGNEREPGRVIVTDLVNRGTPLIRYEIGDLATTQLGPCPCGRGLPRIGRVTGRTSDILYTAEGKRISGISILDTLTIHIPGLKQVQIVQEKLDELTFHVVKDRNFSEETLTILAESVPKYFGPSMKHQVIFVETIPLVGRGKFQFTVCRLKASDLP